MSCKCQECGKQFKVDLMVPDKLWLKIKPKSKNNSPYGGLLCGKCIMTRIESIGKYNVFNLERTYVMKDEYDFSKGRLFMDVLKERKRIYKQIAIVILGFVIGFSLFFIATPSQPAMEIVCSEPEITNCIKDCKQDDNDCLMECKWIHCNIDDK